MNIKNTDKSKSQSHKKQYILHKSIYMKDIQRREIHRDRTCISICLRLGVGGSRMTLYFFVRWWKDSKIDYDDDDCEILLRY